MEPLIQELKKEGVLTEKVYEDAFRAIDRKNFVPDEQKDLAYENVPLHIGHAQTISQPYTVAFMIALLEPKEGEKILDVGSGSGWTTALLAHIVGPSGTVEGIELIPDLVEIGRENLSKYSDLKNAHIEQAGEQYGLPREAPFDKVLVSAAASQIPKELLDQLKVGGTLVMPIQHALWKVEKTEGGTPLIKKHEGFMFVPLLKNR